MHRTLDPGPPLAGGAVIWAWDPKGCAVNWTSPDEGVAPSDGAQIHRAREVIDLEAVRTGRALQIDPEIAKDASARGWTVVTWAEFRKSDRYEKLWPTGSAFAWADTVHGLCRAQSHALRTGDGDRVAAESMELGRFLQEAVSEFLRRRRHAASPEGRTPKWKPLATELLNLMEQKQLPPFDKPGMPSATAIAMELVATQEKRGTKGKYVPIGDGDLDQIWKLIIGEEKSRIPDEGGAASGGPPRHLQRFTSDWLKARGANDANPS